MLEGSDETTSAKRARAKSLEMAPPRNLGPKLARKALMSAARSSLISSRSGSVAAGDQSRVWNRMSGSAGVVGGTSNALGGGKAKTCRASVASSARLRPVRVLAASRANAVLVVMTGLFRPKGWILADSEGSRPAVVDGSKLRLK